MGRNTMTSSHAKFLGLDGVTEAMAWAEKLSHAAELVFGHSPKSANLRKIAKELSSKVNSLVDQASEGSIFSMSVHGRPGIGKSVFRSLFLTQPTGLDGGSDSQISDGATWVSSLFEGGKTDPLGPRPMRLLDIGREYKLGESDQGTVGISPSLIFHITKIDNIADRCNTEFFQEKLGCPIVPCVRLEVDQTPDDAKLRNHVHKWLTVWRDANPANQILDPIFIPYIRRGSVGGNSAISLVAIQNAIMESIASAFKSMDSIEARLELKVSTVLEGAKSELLMALGDFTKKIRPHIEGLADFSEKLSIRLGDELLSNDEVLRSQARRNSMTSWLEKTPDFFFPYKSFSRILALTAGAWDKLYFAAAGSIFSYFSLAYQASKNIGKFAKIQEQLSRSTARRLEAAAMDEIEMKVAEFQKTLDKLGQPSSMEEDENIPKVISKKLSKSKPKIMGLDHLELACKRLMESKLESHEVSALRPIVFGIFGTIIFALLSFPPFYAVYRKYWAACMGSFDQAPLGLEAFPADHFGKLMQIAILCCLPVFFIAMVGMSSANLSSRANQKAQAAKEAVLNKVRADVSSGKIHVTWNDPRLEAVKFLLS